MNNAKFLKDQIRDIRQIVSDMTMPRVLAEGRVLNCLWCHTLSSTEDKFQFKT